MTARDLCCWVVLSMLLAAACVAQSPGAAGNLSYEEQMRRWKGERVKEIQGEEGWLSLLGLFWLDQGQNSFGSDRSNKIVLPRARSPKVAGTIFLDGGKLRLEAAPRARITHDGKPVTSLDLQSDENGGAKPTVLKMGSLTFFVIKRGDRLGLRVKDRSNPARLHFAGLRYYPLDLKWRVEARFEPYTPPRQIPIANVLGMVEDQPSPGAIVFDVGGKTYRLDVIEEKGEQDLFVIFADRTSGKQTYGAGRYLYISRPGADGRVIVDFNKAHNPPCAFTKYATCPLPPRQNRLDIAIEAGEKYTPGKGH